VAQSLLTNIVGGAVAADKYRGTSVIFPCLSHGRIVKLISNSGGAVAADKYRGTSAIFPCSSHGRIVKLISNSGGAVATDKYRGRRSRR